MLHERPTAGRPCELQAIAKAMSATANRAAPCAVPCPLSIAGAMVMCAVTVPGATRLPAMMAKEAVSLTPANWLRARRGKSGRAA